MESHYNRENALSYAYAFTSAGSEVTPIYHQKRFVASIKIMLGFLIPANNYFIDSTSRIGIINDTHVVIPDSIT